MSNVRNEIEVTFPIQLFQKPLQTLILQRENTISCGIKQYKMLNNMYEYCKNNV